ncbi:MAG: hypothetical protein ACTS8R_06415 [Arsenophonus sp. NC-QC1-MAG3]
MRISNKEYDISCGAIHKLDQLLKDHHGKLIGVLLALAISEDKVLEYLA